MINEKGTYDIINPEIELRDNNTLWLDWFEGRN